MNPFSVTAEPPEQAAIEIVALLVDTAGVAAVAAVR